MALSRRNLSQALGSFPGRLYYRSCPHSRVGTTASQRKAQSFQRGLTTVPSPASGISSKWALLIAAGLAVGGAGVFLSTKQDDSKNSQKNFVPSKDDYQKVYNEIARLLIVMDEYDDGSYGPVSLSRISDLDMIRRCL